MKVFDDTYVMIATNFPRTPGAAPLNTGTEQDWGTERIQFCCIRNSSCDLRSGWKPLDDIRVVWW